MKTKILFLGTGGDIFVVGKQYRASAGIIFTFGKNQFHINPGPGSLVMAKMMGINLRQHTGIFVSENNMLSANDINSVIGAMTHNGFDKKGVLVGPKALISGEESFLREEYKDFLEKTFEIDKTNKLGILNTDVEFVNVGKDVYGFKFRTPKFTLGYVPDTEYSNNIGKEVQDADILILNVPDPKDTKRNNHLNTYDAEKIIDVAEPQLVILTGFGIKMLKSDPLYESRELQKNTGVQVISAKDGMTINPISFTTAVRQQTLRKY